MHTIHSDGSLNVNFIDGPNYDHDIVRVDTDGDGKLDSNLQWDLNHDGEDDPRVARAVGHPLDLALAQRDQRDLGGHEDAAEQDEREDEGDADEDVGHVIAPGL